MQLIVIGSSSKGNCYLLKGATETLILEAGCKFSEVKKALDFDLSSIVGCIVTHSHLDHLGKVQEFTKAGINVYSSAGTLSTIDKLTHRHHVVKHGVQFQIGEFRVLPFSVVHDCLEPLGFLIKHPECGITIFITDTMYIPYKFDGLNNAIIEANYDLDIANDNIANGAPQAVRDRVLDTHMSIETLCTFLKETDTTTLNNVVLCHLSDGNSHARNFKKTVQDLLPGKTVTVADKGMVIELNVTPF